MKHILIINGEIINHQKQSCLSETISYGLKDILNKRSFRFAFKNIIFIVNLEAALQSSHKLQVCQFVSLSDLLGLNIVQKVVILVFKTDQPQFFNLLLRHYLSLFLFPSLSFFLFLSLSFSIFLSLSLCYFLSHSLPFSLIYFSFITFSFFFRIVSEKERWPIIV